MQHCFLYTILSYFLTKLHQTTHWRGPKLDRAVWFANLVNVCLFVLPELYLLSTVLQWVGKIESNNCAVQNFESNNCAVQNFVWNDVWNDAESLSVCAGGSLGMWMSL